MEELLILVQILFEMDLWDHAAYNAAKGGVHALTTGLAREFAQYDITVNTIAPPAVESEPLECI